MSDHNTACVGDRHEVACRVNLPVAAPHVSHDSDVECF